MDPFLGEIRLMGFGFNPRYWAQCNGQILPISSNQALFALLGTTYGGNGVTTFALPDLRGRVTLGYGQAITGANYTQGQVGGSENVTVTTANMPAHNHAVAGTMKATASSTSGNPDASYPAQSTVNQYSTGSPNASLGGSTISGTTAQTGGNQAHENRQPLMALNYCIAISGIFPSRN